MENLLITYCKFASLKKRKRNTPTGFLICVEKLRLNENYYYLLNNYQ